MTDQWISIIGILAALVLVLSNRRLTRLPLGTKAWMALAWVAIIAVAALAFSRLPPRLRVAAVLAVVEELPHKETAAALGISVAAVKVRVFRALRLLRHDLEQQGIRP